MSDSRTPVKPIRAARGAALTQSTRRRRNRLKELEQGVDPADWDDRRRAVRALLARPLLREGPERLLVSRHREWLTLWFAHFPAWDLHVNAEAARLYKRPAHTRDASRALRDPSQKEMPLRRRGYVFLCLVLSILSREGRQITLKNVADQLVLIRNAEENFEGLGMSLALDDRPARRDLVQALRVLLDWGVIRRVDGSEEEYLRSDGADVLYTVHHPVLSRLLAARHPPSLVSEPLMESRLSILLHGPASVTESDDWQTRHIRMGLFRRLLDDPVVYVEDLAEEERAYLEKQRHFLVSEIEQATGLVAEIRAEGIAMVDRAGDLSDYRLPETGTDGHVTLLIATWLAKRLRGEASPVIPVTMIEEEIRRLADEHKHWRKDARVAGAEVTLAADVLRRLEALGLLIVVPGDVRAVMPRPAIARYGLADQPPPVEEKKAEQGVLL